MAFRLASAFIELYTKSNIDKGMNDAKSKISSQVSALQSLVASLGLGAAAGSFLRFATVTSASAEEIRSKFEQVFKDQTTNADQFVMNFAGAAGRSISELETFMGDFQTLFVALTFGRGEASELSKRLTELTVDLASFNNMQESFVAEKLISGLVGETEAVRRFGADVRVTAVAQELLRMGIKGSYEAASEQQKVQARLNIILRATKDAHGDAERTAHSLTNRMRAFGAAVASVARVVGDSYTGALADAIGVVSNGLFAFVALNRTFGGFPALAVAVSSALLVVTTGVIGLISAITLLGITWNVVLLSTGVGAIIGIGLAIAGVVSGARALIGWLSQFPQVQAAWNMATQRIAVAFGAALDNVKDLGRYITGTLNQIFGSQFSSFGEIVATFVSYGIAGAASFVIAWSNGIATLAIVMKGFITGVVEQFQYMLKIAKFFAVLLPASFLAIKGLEVALSNMPKFTFPELPETGTGPDVPGEPGMPTGPSGPEFKSGTFGFADLINQFQQAAFDSDPANRTANATEKSAQLLEQIARRPAQQPAVATQ